MKAITDCPICNNKAKLENNKIVQKFKKDKFSIRDFYYKCGNCGEEFTTTATDEVTVNQVYNQYREKYGIPFIEELVNLRTTYNLSAQKMSQILGLGINTYANYEKGEIPSFANSKLINSSKRPEVFDSYLQQSKNVFTKKQFERIEILVKNRIANNKYDYFYSNLSRYHSPNKYTGYTLPNKEKLANLLLYLIANNEPDYNDKLKLNKLLYFTDFISYKNTGKSITGLSYRAIPYGPVPTNYDFIFAHFTEKEKYIEPEFIQSHNSRVIECFHKLMDYDLSLFNEEELETIHQVIKTFKDISSWELVEISHKERSWNELNSSKKVVSYQEYGFDTNENLR